MIKSINRIELAAILEEEMKVPISSFDILKPRTIGGHRGHAHRQAAVMPAHPCDKGGANGLVGGAGGESQGQEAGHRVSGRGQPHHPGSGRPSGGPGAPGARADPESCGCAAS